MTIHNEFAIKTDGLGKSVHELTILQGVNLTVPKNSIFGFLGPNGAGKTTTIKMLLGLSRPTSGKATIFGQDSVKDSLQIRHRIGYLPQEPRFFDFMTPRQTLEFSLRFYGHDQRGTIKRRIDESLDLVGLSDKADRPVKKFSGGEKQRLGLAQAQVHQPDLLILDEPAAALDPMGRRDVLRIMEQLREKSTIFYSTHILDDVQRISDAAAILKNGRIAAQASIDELLNSSNDSVYVVGLQGDTTPLHARIAAQSWINSVQVHGSNGSQKWHIHVADQNKAETELISLLTSDGNVKLTEFGQKKQGLEDLFVNLVEGN